MGMPGRSWSAASADGYRFGYQNQEIDSELWSGAVAFAYRLEDPRLGRFFSVDPIGKKYPYWSPYSFAANRVILLNELEGLENPTSPVYVFCKACGIDEWTFKETEADVIKNAQIAAAVTLDAAIITGGVLTIIASGGTAAIPMIIGYTTGVAAAAGGTIKLINDSQGKFEASNETPASATGWAMVAVNYTKGDEVFSREERLKAEIVEGILTLDPTDFKNFTKLNGLDQAEVAISSINIAIDISTFINEGGSNDQITFNNNNAPEDQAVVPIDNTDTNLKELKVLDLESIKESNTKSSE